MSAQITISTWLFILLLIIAVGAILDRVLIPSTRWFLRRRINRVIDEIGTRLDIEIRPFQLTKRQVLIDIPDQPGLGARRVIGRVRGSIPTCACKTRSAARR